MCEQRGRWLFIHISELQTNHARMPHRLIHHFKQQYSIHFSMDPAPRDYNGTITNKEKVKMYTRSLKYSPTMKEKRNRIMSSNARSGEIFTYIKVARITQE